MIEQIGPWVLSFVGIVGFVLTGRLVWWGWWVNVGCQLLWFLFAFYTGLWGFFIGAVFYTIVFLDNAIGWTKRHRETERANQRRLDRLIQADVEYTYGVISADTISENTITADKIVSNTLWANNIRYISPSKPRWKFWTK